MRVNTYAKRLISIYELSLCLSFVALSLFSLNRLRSRCGECENNLLVLWSVRKKSHHMLILMPQSPSGGYLCFKAKKKNNSSSFLLEKYKPSEKLHSTAHKNLFNIEIYMKALRAILSKQTSCRCIRLVVN